MKKIQMTMERWKELAQPNCFSLDAIQATLADEGIKNATIELLPPYVNDETIWYKGECYEIVSRKVT